MGIAPPKLDEDLQGDMHHSGQVLANAAAQDELLVLTLVCVR